MNDMLCIKFFLLSKALLKNKVVTKCIIQKINGELKIVLIKERKFKNGKNVIFSPRVYDAFIFPLLMSQLLMTEKNNSILLHRVNKHSDFLSITEQSMNGRKNKRSKGHNSCS